MSKYYYNGISLRKYCLDNNINYNTILYRINIIGEKYPYKSLDEIIYLAIHYERYKYYYNGIPLKNYCLNNNLDYIIIISRIGMLKQRYPDMILDDVIDLAIKYKPYKYNCKEISLKKYCDNNDINYNKVITNIKQMNLENTSLLEEEIINQAINYRKSKYRYNGMTLKEYCNTNSILYSKITSKIYKLEKKYPDKTIDEIITLALENKRICKYYYNGMTLRDYCGDKYFTVLRRMKKLENTFDDIPDSDLMLVALEKKSIEEILISNNKYIDNDIRQNIMIKKKIF